MTPEDIDRVFGRSRLKMVTGEHVEVFREEASPGERRRYTKRFLCTTEGDFRHWTEREWRILARLVGHGIGPVPDVVQFDRGAAGRPALVQTYDAGVTVDHWATLLPVARDGRVLRHVFEDCAHWWALAKHCLIALDTIHELHLVHLDLKPDNVCVPLSPADFDPHVPGKVLRPLFGQIALIDFAFSLVAGDSLATALPIGHQAGYEYQSPRLLHALEAGRRGDLVPTRQLDWRCDIYSLGAMLRRYLPQPGTSAAAAWTGRHLADAQALIDRLIDAHDRHAGAQRPHRELIDIASTALRDPALAASLEHGWRLAGKVPVPCAETTPVTRIVSPMRAIPERSADVESKPAFAPGLAARAAQAGGVVALRGRRSEWVRRLVWVAGVLATGAALVPFMVQAWLALQGPGRSRAMDQYAAARSLPMQRSRDFASRAAAGAVTPVAAVAPAADTVPAPAPAAAPAPAPAAAPAPAPAPAAAVAPAAAPPPAPAAVVAREPAAVRAPARARASKPVPTSKPAPTPKAVAVRRPAVTPKAAPLPAVRVAAVPRVSAAPAPSAPTTPAAPVVAASPAPTPTPASEPVPTAAPVSAPAVALPQPPTIEPPPAAARLPEQYRARAELVIADHLPRISQRAERLVLRVLHTAAQMEHRPQDAELLDAARAVRLAPDDALAGVKIAAADAQRLNDSAGNAFWNDRNAQHALDLQLRAFGANPQDAEVAGNLAFYYLKQRPAQAEAARRLALYALALHDPQFPTGRIEDWTTLAIASALTGRERDARNAFFVTLALSPSLDRQCRAATAAYASHGERLRAPAEAMLARIHAWGRSQESPFCRWPPNWWVTARS